MIANALPDGLTTRDRGYIYWPAFGGTLDDGLPADGTLAVTETTGCRKPRHVRRRYAVQALPPTGYPGRVYLLVKIAHAGDADTAAGKAAEGRIGEVYECRVSADGAALPRCTCTAGATAHGRGPTGRVCPQACIHAEVLTDLLLMGLESPFDAPEPPPAPPVPTAEGRHCEQLERARQAHDALTDELEAERATRPEPCPF